MKYQNINFYSCNFRRSKWPYTLNIFFSASKGLILYFFKKMYFFVDFTFFPPFKKNRNAVDSKRKKIIITFFQYNFWCSTQFCFLKSLMSDYTDLILTHFVEKYTFSLFFALFLLMNIPLCSWLQQNHHYVIFVVVYECNKASF